jgi:hypothetical protein
VSKINDGGFAFPMPHTGGGMTLRDYFAAKAMAALISGPDVNDNHYEDETNNYVAGRAYLIADKMLLARDGALSYE